MHPELGVVVVIHSVAVAEERQLKVSWAVDATPTDGVGVSADLKPEGTIVFAVDTDDEPVHREHELRRQSPHMSSAGHP